MTEREAKEEEEEEDVEYTDEEDKSEGKKEKDKSDHEEARRGSTKINCCVLYIYISTAHGLSKYFTSVRETIEREKRTDKTHNK